MTKEPAETSAGETRGVARSGRPQRSQHRSLGAHMTPTAVANRLAAAVVRFGAAWADESHVTLSAGPMVDPAVGEGALLEALIEACLPLAAAPHSAEAVLNFAARLVGVDCSAERLEVARTRLWKALVGRLREDPSETGATRLTPSCHHGSVEPSTLEKIGEKIRSCVDLRLGDSLDGSTWADVPPAALVILNPPWVSLGNRQRSTDWSPSRRAAVLTQFPRGTCGFPTIHGAFLELAARLVAKDGCIAALIPEPVAHLPGYAGARAVLTAHHELRELFQVDPAAFAGVVEPAIGVVLTPARQAIESRSARKRSAAATDGGHGSRVDQVLPMGSRPEDDSAIDADAGSRTWLSTPGSAEDQRLLGLANNEPTFADVLPGLFRDCGVHTGGYASVLVRRIDPNRSRNDDWRGRVAERLDDGELAEAPWVPCRRGRDIRAEELLPPSEELRVVRVARLLERTGVRRTLPRFPSRAQIERVEVLIRQTANRPIAVWVPPDERTWFRNSLLAVDPGAVKGASPVEVRDEIERRFGGWTGLVRYLNDPRIARLHWLRTGDARQRLQPQVKIGHLQALPAGSAWLSGVDLDAGKLGSTLGS